MKRILTLLLALAMLFCLTACGGDEAGTPTGENTGATTNTTESTNGSTDGTQDSTQDTVENTAGGNQDNTQGSTGNSTGGNQGNSQGDGNQGNQQGTTDSTTETNPPSTTVPPSAEPVDCAALTSKYSGRWYLKGYSDIYIDISRQGNDEAMRIDATGISLPGDEVTSTSYTLYPVLVDGYDGWYHGTEIPFSVWNEWLAKKQISLNGTSITMGGKTFVKDAGTKDKYTGKFCKAALGTWYLDKNPDVRIEIKVCGGNEHDGDYYSINTISLNLTTLQHSKNDFCTITAAKISDWEKLGISVSNNKLVISNSYGTKSFNREPTYPTETPTEPPTTNPQPVRVSGVQISKTTLSLKVGDTQQLTATVSPSNADNKNVTWSSNNSSVAQVSSAGKITAKGEGTAVITVTTKDGGYTASCNVTVSVIHVNGVSLNQTALNMTVGKSQQLTATVSPSNADNKNITWSSSNNSVAQVSSTGKVTAKGIGSAIITVSTVDGGYTATCTVTVQSPPAAEQLSDVLIIRGTHTISNQTINTDIYITSTGVATFNNVTVNGNIYCYGQLKCSGCTANNVYAYAYGSMMSCGVFDGTHGKISGGISCNKITILDNALDYAFSKWGKK